MMEKYESLKQKIREIISENHPFIISSAAERCCVSDYEAARAVPEEMRSFASGKYFGEIWKELVSWESASIIVVHKGNIFEIKSNISEGTYGHGFFNITGSSPLGGHIKADNIESICFMSVPFMGLESHSVQFYNKQGSLLFSIYAGRKNKEIIPSVRQSFISMKEKYKNISLPLRKSLVVYSSLTGNTKKIAEAISKSIPSCEIYPIEEAPSADNYYFAAIGYWVDRGMPDAKAKNYISNIKNMNVALFGTLGAWPDSEHAKDCINKSESMLKLAGKENNVLGSFLCQGKVDPAVIQKMTGYLGSVHPMTAEREVRLKEAENHPNDKDCASASELFRYFALRLGL